MEPHLDRPPTRHLERLEVDRLRLLRTTLREIGDGFVVLDVSGASDASATRLPDGVALAGERIAGGSLTVRIDVVGPRTFRYRFALGGDVPAGDTPMLATDVRVADAARCERTAGGVSITAGDASVEVEVPEVGGPTLRVRRADGRLVGTIGGGESNLLGAWDSFPTGICRTPVQGHRHARTGEWIIWARAAFAGCQRYPLHWGGDSSSRWDNLLASVGGGLSLGLCGFPFWSMDIGGFIGEPDDHLLLRWLQAGLFLSHSRIHGFGKRELYDRGATTDLARDLLHLRYRLLPYLLGQAHRAAAVGVPLARPLVVDHPDDPTTWHLSDQWLLGDDLLVAPVATPDGDRRVYLPEGDWVHWFTGEQHHGPTWLATHSPIEHFPLYQRAASLVPLGPVMAHVGARPTDVLTLRAGVPTARSDWRGVARVDGQAVTVTTSRRDPTVVVEGLPPGVDVRIVDGAGDHVDRAIRRG